MVRADWWPPRTADGARDSKAGDIASPVQMINGKHRKMTTRYVKRCNTLYDQASFALGRSKRRCWAMEIPSRLGERSERVGSKFRRPRKVTRSQPRAKQIGNGDSDSSHSDREARNHTRWERWSERMESGS